MVKLFPDVDHSKIKAEVESLSDNLSKSKGFKSPNPGLEKKLEENTDSKKPRFDLTNEYLVDFGKNTLLKEYAMPILVGSLIGLSVGLGFNYVSNHPLVSNYVGGVIDNSITTFYANQIDYKKN